MIIIKVILLILVAIVVLYILIPVITVGIMMLREKTFYCPNIDATITSELCKTCPKKLDKTCNIIYGTKDIGGEHYNKD